MVASTRSSRSSAPDDVTRARAALAAILFVSLLAGLIGIDFGRHWDEAERIGTVIHAIERGELLPNWYAYPSVVHDLLTITAAPEIARLSVLPALTGAAVGGAAFRHALQEHGFLLRARVVLFLASSFGVVWIYLFVRRWRRSELEALVAAGLVAFSWELGYHARWLAPDVLTAAGAGLALFATRRAMDAPSRWAARAFALAGAAAGLACGAKYPSGLLLVVPLVGVIEAARRRRLGALRGVALVVLGFAAAYLATTPGTVLQYGKFATDVHFEIAHYHRGHGGGHTIEPGLPHLLAELQYLTLAALSPWAPLAALFAALALVGAAATLREDRAAAATLLVFPVAYVGYMATQHVMMARNLLVVVPFLAALSARGVGVCRATLLRWRLGERALVVAVGVALAANAAWLLSAGWSCAHPPDAVGGVMAMLSAGGDARYVMTPRVRAAVKSRAAATGSPVPRAALETSAPAGEPGSPLRDARAIAVFYASDVPSPGLWSANHWDYAIRWFGPREVNFDYYPSWMGQDRIVVMQMPRALPLRLPLR
jgi:hypothetical protein